MQIPHYWFLEVEAEVRPALRPSCAGVLCTETPTIVR